MWNGDNVIEKNINSFFNLEDIDLIAKYLYVKAKIEDNNYKFYKKLYEKSILRYFGWVNDGKNKITEFIESFDLLIDSINKKWFDKNFPIILSENHMILNGRHRLAICMYLNIQPSFKKSKDTWHKRFVMDLNFYKNVFSDYEMETFILDYFNNFEDESYFLTFLWWDSENKWNYIKETFKKNECTICYEKKYKYNNKQYFENIIEWLYTYENGIKQNWNLFIKTEWLKQNMKFKLMLLKFDKEKTYRSINIGFPICIQIENIKFWIREKLSSKKEKNFSFLHTSDNYNHTRYLSNFLFNDNIKYLKKISKHNKFINKTNNFLIEFNNYLNNNKLNKYDFCFESWIILQIFWIRKAADLDFICLKNLRNNIKNLPKDIDLHNEDRFKIVSKLSDDEIINNRENYFFYKWFKFIVPNLLIKNTINLSKKKNLDMIELQNFIDQNSIYKLNIFYKIKVFMLLKYYWLRRRIIDALALVFSKKQKHLIKKYLNKYFGQNYNLDHD
jgi:hypothetical protein